MACFADINVSQGSVATYARCGGIFSMHLTANLPGNLPVKKFLNRLRIDRIMVASLWLRFLAYPVRHNWGLRMRSIGCAKSNTCHILLCSSATNSVIQVYDKADILML